MSDTPAAGTPEALAPLDTSGVGTSPAEATETAAPSPEPAPLTLELIDEDTEAYLRIRGHLQGQNLLTEALLMNDIEGVRYYLSAMEERWPAEAAEVLGTRLSKEDFIAVNPGEKTFFEQVFEATGEAPAIKEALLRKAAPLTRAVTDDDYDRATLLMDAGFELNAIALESLLRSKRSTEDTLVWLQLASPEKFQAAVAGLSPEVLASGSIAEDKLRFVLNEAPDETIERLARSKAVNELPLAWGGLQTMRVLGETVLDLQPGALGAHIAKRGIGPHFFRDSGSSADVAFFIEKVKPALDASPEAKPGLACLGGCASVEMLQAVLPCLEQKERSAKELAGALIAVASVQEKEAFRSMPVEERQRKQAVAEECARAFKEHFKMEHAGITPKVEGWGESRELPANQLAVIKVFGPDKIHAEFNLDDWLMTQPKEFAGNVEKQLAAHGIEASAEKGDIHRAVVALRSERYNLGLGDLRALLNEKPSLLHAKNDRGHTVADCLLLGGLPLERLNAEALGELRKAVSPLIDGLPPAHAYAQGPEKDERVQEWAQKASAFGFDLLAPNAEGKNVLMVAAEQGNSKAFRVYDREEQLALAEYAGRTDLQGNNLLHTMAKACVSGALSQYVVESFREALQAVGAFLPTGSAVNAEGKTPAQVLREGAAANPERAVELSTLATNLEQAAINESIERNKGLVEPRLTGLSQSGARASVKFIVVKEDEQGVRREVDVTLAAVRMVEKAGGMLVALMGSQLSFDKASGEGSFLVNLPSEIGNRRQCAETAYKMLKMAAHNLNFGQGTCAELRKRANDAIAKEAEKAQKEAHKEAEKAAKKSSGKGAKKGAEVGV